MTWRISRLSQVHRYRQDSLHVSLSPQNVGWAKDNCVTQGGKLHHFLPSGHLYMYSGKTSGMHACAAADLSAEMHGGCPLLLPHLMRPMWWCDRAQQLSGIAGMPRASRNLSQVAGPSTGAGGAVPVHSSAPGLSPSSHNQGEPVQQNAIFASRKAGDHQFQYTEIEATLLRFHTRLEKVRALWVRFTVLTWEE